MDTVPRMVAVLTIVCCVAAIALSQVYSVTKEPIANAEKNEQLKAIKAVLPPYDNDPLKEVEKHKYEGSTFEFYAGKKAGELVGRAVKVKSDSGYSGTIEAMLGIAPDGKITGLYILKHSETPGLGAKIVEKAFTDQFTGKQLGKCNLCVKKDGGDIDQITGATISPRAVCFAVRQGLLAHKALYEKKSE
ncbi:MAG: RnfABCDGE type electron transport complex subunit G [Candidatus Coatesbacteria bacterium]|nr:RnfABCDGE type electron transport complex subunit G [Candidatus Coatesbacteria bacterium]